MPLPTSHSQEHPQRLLLSQPKKPGEMITTETYSVLTRTLHLLRPRRLNGKQLPKSTQTEMFTSHKTCKEQVTQLSRTHLTTRCNSWTVLKEPLVFNTKEFSILMTILSNFSETSWLQEVPEASLACKESSKSWTIIEMDHLKFKSSGKLFAISEFKSHQKRLDNFSTFSISMAMELLIMMNWWEVSSEKWMLSEKDSLRRRLISSTVTRMELLKLTTSKCSTMLSSIQRWKLKRRPRMRCWQNS